MHAYAMDNIMFYCLSSLNSVAAAFRVDGLTRQENFYCFMYSIVVCQKQNRKFKLIPLTINIVRFQEKLRASNNGKKN